MFNSRHYHAFWLLLFLLSLVFLLPFRCFLYFYRRFQLCWFNRRKLKFVCCQVFDDILVFISIFLSDFAILLFNLILVESVYRYTCGILYPSLLDIVLELVRIILSAIQQICFLVDIFRDNQLNLTHV